MNEENELYQPESPSSSSTKSRRKTNTKPRIPQKPHKANSLLLQSIFSYSTVRLARIHSKKIAILFRFLQLSILGYVVGWSIIYKRGYQQKDLISSTVSTKVKGLGYIVNSLSNKSTGYYLDGKVLASVENNLELFDPADYVIPASEYNSIFIMTNFIKTQQSRGFCEEDYRCEKCMCKKDTDCIEKVVTNSWSGIPTGKCIRSTHNSSIKICEVASWCPVEIDSIENQHLINNVEDYTIFIKNDVKFERFNKRHRNLLLNITNEYIKTCTYEPHRDPFCPVFTVKEILNQAEPDIKERQKMLKKGGLVRILIEWNCNYDIFSRECLPKYSFDRFDVPYKDKSSASGYNFRFADKFERNGTIHRQLTKSYGIRLIITVTGEAGKFSFLPLLLTLGSGLGLLSLATIITDLILLNLTNKKLFYRQLKELDHKIESCKDIEKKSHLNFH